MIALVMKTPSKCFFDLSNQALDYQLSSASFGFFFLKRQKLYFILSSCWKQFCTSRKARKLTIDCLTVVVVMTYFLKFLFNYFVPFKKKRLKCNEHLKSGVVSPKGWGGGGGGGHDLSIFNKTKKESNTANNNTEVVVRVYFKVKQNEIRSF